MAGIPEKIVADSMESISACDAPPALRASIERQSRSLMELASSLMHVGMDEQQVRSIVDRACASYRDELISTILTLKNNHET